MMSTDKIDDTIRNIIRPSHFYPIYDMVFDDLSTLYRCEFIMWIDRCFLIFSKVERIFHLSYIVIKSPYPHQHCISTNRQCTGLG